MHTSEPEEEDEPYSHNEIKMMYILNQKKVEATQFLVKSLTRKNNDFEACLNAHHILNEISDNHTSYPFVGDPAVLSSLIDA